MNYCAEHDCKNKAEYMVYDLSDGWNENYCRDHSNEYITIENFSITLITK